jgi:DNA-binding beta-propeller fold protein YncE
MHMNRCKVMCFLALAAIPGALAAQGYKVTGSIKIGGTGGWDYLSADAQSRRLYVSHGTEVVVIDLDSQKVLGKVGGMKGIHGIAVDHARNLGFITDGGNNQVVFFDLKTLEVKKKVPAGTNPDGLVFDEPSHRVFAFNGRSQDATVIDTSNGHADGTIALGGKPEFPVSDGSGSVFANIEDKNEIVQIDSATLQVKAHWPVTPCESPSGLALDPETHRLFAVCDNKMMAVVDANSGKVLATPAIGDGPDAAGFDGGTKTAFSSNGEGTLSVINATDYSVVETIPTAKGARTMTLDPSTHKLYLATADLGPAPTATAANPHPRPAILPGSFRILVLSREK